MPSTWFKHYSRRPIHDSRAVVGIADTEGDSRVVYELDSGSVLLILKHFDDLHEGGRG